MYFTVIWLNFATIKSLLVEILLLLALKIVCNNSIKLSHK